MASISSPAKHSPYGRQISCSNPISCEGAGSQVQTFLNQADTGTTERSAIDDFLDCFNQCQAAFGRSERLRRTTLLGCSALAGITGALALPILTAPAVLGLSAALGTCIATLGGFEVGLATNCVARCLPRLLQALPAMQPVIPGGRPSPLSALPPGIPGFPPDLTGLLASLGLGGFGGADTAAAAGFG